MGVSDQHDDSERNLSNGNENGCLINYSQIICLLPMLYGTGLLQEAIYQKNQELRTDKIIDGITAWVIGAIPLLGIFVYQRLKNKKTRASNPLSQEK